jgi:hypothetical protein
MWTEYYSPPVKSRYVHQNWSINHLGGAAEPSSRTHNWQHAWPPRPVDADDVERWNERPSSQDRLYCFWKHSSSEKRVCLNLRTHDLPVRLVFRKSGYNSILYFTHVLPTNTGIVQATNASSQIFCHPQHNYRLCLPPGEQQENNNDQNYTFLKLFKDLSVMVIDNCNFAL